MSKMAGWRHKHYVRQSNIFFDKLFNPYCGNSGNIYRRELYKLARASFILFLAIESSIWISIVFKIEFVAQSEK